MGTSRSHWMAMIDVVILAPLLAAPLAAATQNAEVLSNLSAITGLLAASFMVVTIAALSRIKGLLRSIGIEAGKALHIRMGIATAVMTAVHIVLAIAASPHEWADFNPIDAPPAVLTGAGAAALIFMISVRFRPLGGQPNYARRARWHAVGAVGVVVLVGAHVVLLDRLVSDPLNAAVLGVFAIAALSILTVRWVLRPLADQGAHVVQSVRAENSVTFTLVLFPVHLRRPMRLEPGQFVWLRLRRSPISTTEHPFTVAHAARNGRIEVTIRVRGAFTRTLRELEPGTRIWVDGPYGSFIVPLAADDPAASDGLVFIAGGVGITPIAAALRALAQIQDSRPHHLLLAERPGEGLFGHELDRHLVTRLHLTVARTNGARIEPQLLARTLPPDTDRRAYLVCGGPGLVTAAIQALTACGVPRDRITTEQF